MMQFKNMRDKMKDFNVIKFQFGKKRRTLKEWIKIGALMHVSLNVVSKIPGIKKEQVFNVLDDFQRHLNIEVINDYIIQDSELLTFRLNRVLNDALKQHQKDLLE